LLGFETLPDAQRFGILPKGRILRSPCKGFHLQLIEPEPSVLDVEDNEHFQRLGLGTSDVTAAVAKLSATGVEFVEHAHNPTHRAGALTRNWMGSVSFELVGHTQP
jgi:4-hydroxyphenylpyruvate dioxygenase